MTNQRGLIVANAAAHVIISAHAHAAYRVRSWQNGVAVKTQDKLFAVLRAKGLTGESVFDAAHGRRYMLFVYRDREERKACWDAITGEIKCSYPKCKCIVSTSTTQPEPICPKGLEKDPLS